MNKVKIGAKDEEFILRFQDGDLKIIPMYGIHAKYLLKSIINSNLSKIVKNTISGITES